MGDSGATTAAAADSSVKKLGRSGIGNGVTRQYLEANARLNSEVIASYEESGVATPVGSSERVSAQLRVIAAETK
jgi:hypothetical protein